MNGDSMFEADGKSVSDSMSRLGEGELGRRGRLTHIGNYKIIREIGRGSMGTVYLAHQESLGRDLAVKVLSPAFTQDHEFLERFQREGRAAARLRHPNIVQVFDAGCSDGLYYIAMEYGGRETLKSLIERCKGGLPLNRAVKIAEQVLQALECAHNAGIIHRDVKPANILLAEDDQVRLTDFSIAHIRTATRLTHTGAPIGTPEYMSPEQFDGRNVDHRTDLYAVGIILYEMLTGIQPFRAETTPQVLKAHMLLKPTDPSELVPGIAPEVGAVVLKALEKKPADRFESAAEMRQALLEAAGGQADRSLQNFLEAVRTGRVTLDDAIKARDMVKEAIDRGFRKVLTVMMIDLAGSSRLKVPSQTLHADRAFREYRAEVNRILGQHGCRAHDWSGDGAIALFEQAQPAVTAAMEIHRALAEVSKRNPYLKAPLQARIGINTGEVYWDPQRSLGEFASRTVDQAGHLEKDCPPGCILLSESTKELLGRPPYKLIPLGTNRDGVKVFQIGQSGDLKKCAKCGVVLVQGAVFCSACGTPVRAMTGKDTAGAGPRKLKQATSVGKATGPKTVTRSVYSPPGAKSQNVREKDESDNLHGESFRLWWGWWVGAFSFLLNVVGMVLPNEALILRAPSIIVGALGLLFMFGLTPILCIVYWFKGRKSAAKQALLAEVVFFLFLLLSSAFGEDTP